MNQTTQPSVWRPMDYKTFMRGAPYYPEQTKRELWEEDATRMVEAGCNVTRLGEFAWHLFEPVEGQYDFSLFDEAIEVLGKQGIKTIFCTPTATPPVWLSRKHPEILRIDERGVQSIHGSRQQADTTNALYREYSKKITNALTEHYKDNEHVIGWQTDNELNTTTGESYTPQTRARFQDYLKEKYDSIEQLNDVWGGSFWATGYQSFEEIDLPIDWRPGPVSPSQKLDFHRFLAKATADFQRDQVEIIRAKNPDWFVFHNFGVLNDLDFHSHLSSDLDFNGYDIYPMMWDEIERLGDLGAAQAMQLDLFRSHSGNFIVPEHQSGFGSQPHFATLTPEPGEMRRMAMTSVSRGADSVLFFRWRPAHFGAEIYWMGLLDHDNVPRRRFSEARQFNQDMALIESKILGTQVKMDIAVAAGDFDNEQAQASYSMGLPSDHEAMAVIHRYNYQSHYAAGCIHPSDDLSPLKCLIVPHWPIWKSEWTANVTQFVQNGGVVVITARTGSRDMNNHVHNTQTLDADLESLTGVSVTEFGIVAGTHRSELTQPKIFGRATEREDFGAEADKRRYKIQLGQKSLTGSYIYEVIEAASDVETVATWSNRFLSGKAAVTQRKLGKGYVYYVATHLDDAACKIVLQHIYQTHDIQPVHQGLPEQLEVSVREDAATSYEFVINKSHLAVEIPVRDQSIHLVTDAELIEGRMMLPGYGVHISEVKK